MTVAELGEELSDDCYIALVSREGEGRVPHAENVLEDGDHITLIGRKDAVRNAVAYCHPE
jgi:Trk K+ transport system NAD-binding subunit